MVETIQIKTFKSRFSKGKYDLQRKTIFIREGLTKEERRLTFKHELEHHYFYTRNFIGKMLSFLYKRKQFTVYLVALAMAWVFFPLLYLILLTPLFLDNLHEMTTSIIHPSKLSFSVAFSFTVAMYSAFWIRLIL